MFKEVKAIIFDVNGVLLLETGKSFHEYISKKLNVDIESWFDSIEQYWTSLIGGTLTESKFLKLISGFYNISPKTLQKIIQKAFKKRFKKNKDLFKKILKLKRLGYKIAILSDQIPASYEIFERYFKLEEFVDVAVWSNKIGVRKPNPKIYKICLKKLNISPSQAIFVDNREWNLSPAKKLGIRTILYENNKQLFKHPVWRKLFK
jgi:putative hydrolase of the HAD superfamily